MRSNYVRQRYDVPSYRTSPYYGPLDALTTQDLVYNYPATLQDRSISDESGLGESEVDTYRIKGSCHTSDVILIDEEASSFRKDERTRFLDFDEMAQSIVLHRFEIFFGLGALNLISRTAVVQIAYVAKYLKTIARVVGLAFPDKLMRCGTTAYDVALRIHRLWLVFIVSLQTLVCLAQTFDLLGTGGGKTPDKFVQICR